jgi:hypothetical protein
VAESVPKNPIRISKSKIQVQIEVLIPCIERDLDVLPLCILGIVKNSENPISRIRVISKSTLSQQLHNQTHELLYEVETETIPSQTLNDIKHYVPADKRGWVTKQILAMWVAYSSSEQGVLVIDADTILLNKRLFLSPSRQILFPVVEFNLFDADTTYATWPVAESFPVSFTAHHLLLQPNLVREMFDSIGGFQDGTRKWLESTSNGSEWKPISDMHSYGTWLLSEYPRNVRFGKWINLRVSRTLLSGYSKKDADWMFKELESKFQNYNSVSFHHYLKDNFVGSE